MAKQTINVGSADLAGDGESIRAAFTKVNSNFTEVYTQVPLATTATYAQSFNTSTLVRAAVSATNVVNGTWTLALSTAGSILLNGTVFSGGAVSATTSTLINGTSIISLSTSGALTFPDATVQTTAWTGASSITWPVTNTAGASGPTKVAIGRYAGDITQGANAVAIGNSAGYTGQVAGAVAIGWQTGETTQGNSAVAIGNSAGRTSQGASAVAIGLYAGYTDQAANTIILNASGSAVNGVFAQTDSFYVAPIRTDATPANILYYNTSTKEVTYGTPIVPNGTKASTATGTAGQTSYDSTYFYICIATNTWRRVALGSTY